MTAKPGVKLEDLEATVLEAELAKLQNDGPTAEEVEAAKAGELTEKITGLQRLGGFGGVADTLDEYNQYTGDPGFLPKDIAMSEAVSVAEHEGRGGEVSHQGLSCGGVLRAGQEGAERRTAQPGRYGCGCEDHEPVYAGV